MRQYNSNWSLNVAQLDTAFGRACCCSAIIVATTYVAVHVEGRAGRAVILELTKYVRYLDKYLDNEVLVRRN